MSRFLALLGKEIKLEYRNKYSVSGVFLYVLGTVYIFKSSFADMQPQIWNAVLWMLALFSSINAVSRSFSSESGQANLYYYQLISPLEMYVSKVIYNIVYLFFLFGLSYAALVFIAGNPVKVYGLFFFTLFLAALGLSLTLTFVSGMISKARSNSSLMTILVIPLVVPVILLLLKLSANSLRIIQDSSYYKDVLMLCGIDLLLVAMSILLFPYAWKD